MERVAEELPGDCHGGCRSGQRRGNRSLRRRNPAALKRLIGAGTQLRAFPQPVMDACLKASNEVNVESSATNPDYKKVLELDAGFPQRVVSLVAGRGIHL